MVKVADDANPPAAIAEYRCDGLGRRIQKIVAGSPGVTYDYYYNESRQVLEVRKGGDTDPLEQYVWDIRYMHSPVVRWRDGNCDGSLDGGAQDGDSTLYYSNDANFNVTALVDASDGAVVERYAYDPYGKVSVRHGVRDSAGCRSAGLHRRMSVTMSETAPVWFSTAPAATYGPRVVMRPPRRW